MSVAFRYPPRPEGPTKTWPYRWRTRKQEPQRFGQLCRQVAEPIVRGGWAAFGLDGAHHGAATVTVEFQDGTRVVTNRGCIRRVRTEQLDRHARK